MGLSLPHLAIFGVIFAVFWVIPISMVLRKAGFNRMWALACFFPLAVPVTLWVLAVVPWRADDYADRF